MMRLKKYLLNKGMSEGVNEKYIVESKALTNGLNDHIIVIGHAVFSFFNKGRNTGDGRLLNLWIRVT